MKSRSVMDKAGCLLSQSQEHRHLHGALPPASWTASPCSGSLQEGQVFQAKFLLLRLANKTASGSVHHMPFFHITRKMCLWPPPASTSRNQVLQQTFCWKPSLQPGFPALSDKHPSPDKGSTCNFHYSLSWLLLFLNLNSSKNEADVLILQYWCGILSQII